MLLTAGVRAGVQVPPYYLRGFLVDKAKLHHTPLAYIDDIQSILSTDKKDLAKSPNRRRYSYKRIGIGEVIHPHSSFPLLHLRCIR